MNRIRVASVPSDHVYVRHLEGASSPSGVVRLPDPPVPGAPPGQWWPPRQLDPDWLRRSADGFDLLHVHFGFEHLAPADLGRTLSVLRELGKPLVLTVHDLENPHLHDQSAHRARLELLVSAAASVITLTRGAAREIAARWGRAAHVLAHPHVVDLDRMAQARPAGSAFAVAVHDKRRANIDAAGSRAAVARALEELPGGLLRTRPAHRLTDAELWDHLAGLDALVLPYTHGTHSGFVEACHDLGTTVIASRVGYLAEQQPLLSYDLGSETSLVEAVRTAHRERRRWRARPQDRAAQRDQLAAAHRNLYAAALAA